MIAAPEVLEGNARTVASQHHTSPAPRLRSDPSRTNYWCRSWYSPGGGGVLQRVRAVALAVQARHQRRVLAAFDRGTLDQLSGGRDSDAEGGAAADSDDGEVLAAERVHRRVRHRHLSALAGPRLHSVAASRRDRECHLEAEGLAVAEVVARTVQVFRRCGRPHADD